MLLFIAFWFIANVLGFVLGSFLGATNGGLIAGIMGDLVFGVMIGLAQWSVLAWWMPTKRTRLALWIPLTAVGFMLGVRLGARLAVGVSSEHMLIGIAFGVIVGTMVGLAQIAVIYWAWGHVFRRALRWLPISILAWIGGEGVAFAFYFAPEGVPLVGLMVALVTLGGLLLIDPASFKRQMSVASPG
jgi:hypothetical protein